MPIAPDLSGHALDDRYELHAVIGEGAFGRVYQGRDRRLARPVAVKVIKPWWTEDPDWVGSFEREVQLLARVSDPGIVQIFDVGHADEGLYYVSELVDGENLASRLRRGPLPPWEACGIAAQLCRALSHAHAQRIVHRDVKPANIMLSSRGRVKVGDFGVARLAEGSTDGAAATIVGTPRYMAPEQGRGRPTTPATDIYSVGVVLYEMLAGRPPFTGDSAVELALRHLQDAPPPLSVRLAPALTQIVDRALAKDPADRYADGAEMADALVQARRQAASDQRNRIGRPRTRTAPHARARALAPVVPAGGGSDGGSDRGSDGPASRTATLVQPRQPPPPGDHAATIPPRRPGPTPGDHAATIPPRRPDPTPGDHTATIPPRRPDPTRAAPRMSPRRNINPPARRRAVAALGLALALLASMVVAAVLLGRTGHTRVPVLTHLTRSAATAAARRRHLHTVYRAQYAAAAAGTVISQLPRAGARVKDGDTVRALLSLGPAPVEVPLVVKESSTDARAALAQFGLSTTVTQVPAPGISPGTVVRQTPAAGLAAPAKSSVTLLVAETPQWRPLTTFQARRSVPFRIRGTRWRVVYKMAYQGDCTLIFFCSGPPTAQVANLDTGSTVSPFSLGNGTGRIQTFQSGPGVYQIEVSPGDDTARWSIEVDDYY
jgi:serine/threonine protein kinase